MGSNVNMHPFVLFLLVLVASQSRGFSISEVRPPDKSYWVKAGSDVVLSCTASEKYNLCQWQRPDGQTCGIMSSQNTNKPVTEECQAQPNDGRKWTVRKGGAASRCDLELKNVTILDAGDWQCHLSSFPDENDRYKDVEEEISIVIADKPRIAMEGPLTLIAEENAERLFTCTVHSSKGNKKSDVSWWLGDQPLNIIEGPNVDVQEDGFDTEKTVVKVTGFVSPDWNGGRIRCKVLQEDDLGNIMENSDERVIAVGPFAGRDLAEAKRGNPGEFQVVQRYPAPPNGGGGGSQIPEMLLKPGVSVTFSCQTSTPWNVCRWKRPDSDEPCGVIYPASSTGQQCYWTSTRGQWTIRAESPTKCVITGSEVTAKDIGEWNCDFNSFPVQVGEHSTYDSDQKFFSLDLVTPATIESDAFPERVEVTDGDKREFTVRVATNGRSRPNPMPEFNWHIEDDGRPLNVRILDGEAGVFQTVEYEAKVSHNGRRLVCSVNQKDDEGNLVSANISTMLMVKAKPPEPQREGLSVGVIAIIASVCFIVLLVLLIIIFLWRAQRMCFKKAAAAPPVTRNPGLAMGVQTSVKRRGEQSVGVGADFGPPKPSRSMNNLDVDIEEQPLIGRAAMEKMPDLSHILLADDTLKQYSEEGENMSVATSLSSLNTVVSEKDWEEAFRALGGKFSMLADLAGGLIPIREDEAAETQKEDESPGGGTEI